MKSVKLVHDKTKCVNCGACTVLKPDHFEMVEGDVKLKSAKATDIGFEKEIENKDDFKDVVESCPTGAIYFSDSD